MPNNNKKSPEDEWFVSARGEENFVRPLGGRHSRESAIRRFRRTRIASEVEFVLPVRLESRKLPRKNQLYETLTQGSRAKNPKSHQLYVALSPGQRAFGAFPKRTFLRAA